jgi:hypothetical protein
MRFAKQLAAGAGLIAWAAAAVAHEGHNMPGASHWHATDTAGLAVMALLAAIAIWLARGK